MEVVLHAYAAWIQHTTRDRVATFFCCCSRRRHHHKRHEELPSGRWPQRVPFPLLRRLQQPGAPGLSLVPDVFPVLAAAHKVLLSKARDSLTTRTLHSELVYNYS
ncbi:hypothetical protein BS78_05G152700 [Paspalum vaginatum]|nr:hypothetical protein BS78_05G152700 [Paspalum vaginatum]